MGTSAGKGGRWGLYVLTVWWSRGNRHWEHQQVRAGRWGSSSARLPEAEHRALGLQSGCFSTNKATRRGQSSLTSPTTNTIAQGTGPALDVLSGCFSTPSAQRQQRIIICGHLVCVYLVCTSMSMSAWGPKPCSSPSCCTLTTHYGAGWQNEGHIPATTPHCCCAAVPHRTGAVAHTSL